jgi:signal transduction histidine kinase/ligand-binding sensor domain-containing protein
MQRNILLFLLAYFFCGDCLSQQYPFVHYTPADGLVNNRTRFICQDRKGLLYISTFGGLSVYDGSRFTNYTTNNGLAFNMVNDIIEMGEDSLWIIPNMSKIHCLVKGNIHNIITSDGFYPVINKMIRCSDGSYYAMADEGLFRFENNRFIKINLVDRTGKDAGRFFVNALEIKNKLFLITDVAIHPSSGPGRILLYDFKTNAVSINQSTLFFSILSSPEGDILAATEQGVKKIDEKALTQNQIRLISLPPIYRAAEKIVASFLYFDHHQNLWLCTASGVVKIDRNGELTLFSVKNGLPVSGHVSLFEDKENTMWFADGLTGISKLVNPQFELYSQIKPGFVTSDLYTDSKTDSVWFLDKSHNKLLLNYHDHSKEFQLSHRSVPSFYRYIAAHGNKVYLSDAFNIYQLNFSGKGHVRSILLHRDISHNVNKALNCILPDGYGNLLASSEDLSILIQNEKPISFPLGYFCDKFVITADDHLWIATRGNKLYSFILHPKSPDHYLQLLRAYSKELPEMSPRSIAVDKLGNVWLGTRDKGLFCLSFKGPELQSWKQITSKDGLSDNFISYLHTDEDNNIWACSPGGLDKIQPKGGSFSIENTTRSNNIYQYISKIQTSKGGVHWIQTGEGVIRIAPAETPQNNFQPKILFREIYEGRNKINTQSGPLSLSYSENNLSFSMAAPSFIDEKQIRFTYFLEGSSNKSWSDPSSQAVVNLANLAPGRYTLKAKASFVNGRYPDSETSFSFVINVPWWQTWWFILLAASFIAIASWSLIRSYYQRKLRQQRAVLEKQQAIEKERTRIATDMHDDLGAGLSTIRFLGEKVKRNTFSQVTREDIERMQATSNELIDKMNEIIWSMSEKNDSLEDLALYIRSYSMQYCEDNNLDCSIELPEQIPTFFVSGEMRRNIFLTVKESLHNIIKHANAKNVSILVKITTSLAITIMDDGTGLQRNGEGRAGNGLWNMQQRIESIGGTLNIQNGDGVTVRLNVPLE